MASNLTRSTARIYGALTALGDGSVDLLDRLLPFFEPILRPLQGNVLDLEHFAGCVRDTYRWNFNTDVVEVFIPRLVDAGWLTALEPSVKQTNYIVSLPDQILSVETEATAESQLRALAEDFQTFARELSPLSPIPVDIAKYEDILIEWLLYVEAFSEQNLNFTTRTVPVASGASRQIVKVPQSTTLSDEENVLCARFVEHTINHNPESSETLSRIASIGLLTEVIQDFVKPTTNVETSNLAVYLDAPVAMELLGVSGRAARENTEPVIAELDRIGARVQIFHHSIAEIQRNLNAVLSNSQPTGPTASALAKGEVLQDYVMQVAADPEAILKDRGIRVVHRTIEQYPSENAYFTEEHRQEIYSALTFQQNANARAHDADVTTLIMRQRKGYQNRDIFKSRFLLMTRNGLLAQLVRRRCVDSGVLDDHAIPPVVHRRVVTASMWLRTGLRAGALEVPRRLLLANCERVLALRPNVVGEVKRVAEALGDEEKIRQLDVLVRQHRSTQMLMDKTLGAHSVVNEENFGELFQQMLHPHLEEERKKSEHAIELERAEGRKRVEKVARDLEQARTAESAAAAQLNARSQEDKAIIETVCGDVAIKLANRRRARKISGIAVSLMLCLPPLFESTFWQSYLSFIFALPLAYWSITGTRLIGTLTTDEHAQAALVKVAGERGLAAKMSRFSTDWRGEEFVVTEKVEGDSDESESLVS